MVNIINKTFHFNNIKRLVFTMEMVFVLSEVGTGCKVEAVLFRRCLNNNSNSNINKNKNNNNNNGSRAFLQNIWHPPTSLYGVIIPTSVEIKILHSRRTFNILPFRIPRFCLPSRLFSNYNISKCNPV